MPEFKYQPLVPYLIKSFWHIKKNSTFTSLQRYARCWWHLTLHIINVEKKVSRLLFHFFFLICACIPWVWLGWRWCGCVLVYFSLFRKYHFLVFIDFYFILACLYICVLLVFSFRYLFQCLLVCLFISFVFPFCIYLLFILCTILSFFPWKYILL